MECKPVKCAPPGSMPNLKSIPDLTQLIVFQNKISYECAEGYTLNAKAGGESKFDLECAAEGLFKPDVFPVCQPVTCGEPPKVKKAAYASTAVAFPGIVTYTCDPGRSL